MSDVKIICCNCYKEFDVNKTPGGLLISPPISACPEENGALDDAVLVKKWHICADCFPGVESLIMCGY